MLLSDHFVFLHLPKTGGRFVRDLLLRTLSQTCEIESLGTHSPASLIPKAYREVPRFGFIRNPWDWYVSWYHYMMQRQHPHLVFAAASRGWRAPFDETINRVLSGDMSPEPVEGQDEVITESLLQGVQAMQRLDIGFLSWRFLYTFYADADALFQGTPDDMDHLWLPDNTRIRRQEELRASLIALLDELAVPLGPDTLAIISNSPRTNLSDRRGYAEYYPDALIRLVAHKERFILRLFGYRFGEGESS